MILLRGWAVLTLLAIALIIFGCATEVPHDLTAGAPAPLLRAPDVPDVVLVPPPALDYTLTDAGRYYFGDTLWHCCWSDLCERLADLCTANKVLITDGLRHCCAPDLGQCQGVESVIAP